MRGTVMKEFTVQAQVKLILVLSCLCLSCIRSSDAAFGFGKSDSVRLEDVSVLTLYHGKMTAARRSSAVPQLKCIGGSAANAFTPQVVQCYNRGSDGYDVQWECKTDMDNAYRFGQIEVTCEGYSSSDDDLVLRGSCGLEFTLEYTKEGMQQKNQGNQHSYYGNDQDSSSDNYYNHQKSRQSSKTDWLFLAIVGVLIYIIYRTCIADSTNRSSTQASDDGYPGPRGSGFGSGGGGGGGGGGQPPPSYSPNDSCGGSQGYSSGHTRNAGGAAAGGGGGFWTGAAAGGMLGYLFGNGNRGYGGGYGGYNRPRYGFSAPRRNTGFSSGWGGGGGGGFSGFGGGSTGTRTASGFGGTRRR